MTNDSEKSENKTVTEKNGSQKYYDESNMIQRISLTLQVVCRSRLINEGHIYILALSRENYEILLVNMDFFWKGEEFHTSYMTHTTSHCTEKNFDRNFYYFLRKHEQFKICSRQKSPQKQSIVRNSTNISTYQKYLQ